MSDSATGSAHQAPGLAIGLAVFAMAIAAGVAVRFGHSLSVDEPFVANTLRRPWPDVTAAFTGDNLPLFYVLLRGWTAIWGDGELALRGVSILAYGAAAVLTALSALRVSGPAAAWLAGALMVSSVRIGVVHAATARPYALLCLWSAAVLWLVVSRDRSVARPAVRAGVLALVFLGGLFTHPLHVFVIASAVVASLAVAGPWRRLLPAAAIIAVCVYGVTWGRTFVGTLESSATSWMQAPRVADLVSGFLMVWGTGPGALLVGAALVLVLRERGATSRWMHASTVRWALLFMLALWFFPFVASLLQPVYLSTRTPILALPAMAVLLASVIATLGGRLAALTVAALFVLYGGGSVLSSARGPDPVPTRDAVAIVAARARCGDVLLAPGLADQGVAYYMTRMSLASCVEVQSFPSTMRDLTIRIGDATGRTRLDDEARVHVASLTARGGGVWLFVAHRGIGHEVSEMLVAHLQAVRRCDAPLPLQGASFQEVVYCAPPAGQSGDTARPAAP